MSSRCFFVAAPSLSILSTLLQVSVALLRLYRNRAVAYMELLDSPHTPLPFRVMLLHYCIARSATIGVDAIYRPNVVGHALNIVDA